MSTSANEMSLIKEAREKLAEAQQILDGFLERIEVAPTQSGTPLWFLDSLGNSLGDSFREFKSSIRLKIEALIDEARLLGKQCDVAVDKSPEIQKEVHNLVLTYSETILLLVQPRLEALMTVPNPLPRDAAQVIAFKEFEFFSKALRKWQEKDVLYEVTELQQRQEAARAQEKPEKAGQQAWWAVEWLQEQQEKLSGEDASHAQGEEEAQRASEDRVARARREAEERASQARMGAAYPGVDDAAAGQSTTGAVTPEPGAARQTNRRQ